MRLSILSILIIISIYPCSGYTGASIQDVLDERYIFNISELPYSPGTPQIKMQEHDHIRGWVDIVGFRNLSRKGDTYYILGDPVSLAIVAGDAKANPPGVLDGLDKSIVLTQSGYNLIASLNVVLKWHINKICSDDKGSFVCGKDVFTETATFQDIEPIPIIISNHDDAIQVLYREMNFSLFNTTDIRININNSIYDRYLLTTKNGSYEKINRLWRVEQTVKGIYCANESIVNIFHSNNISHAQDIISVSNLNFTVTAHSLYFSTDKINVTVQKENHDPLPQFTDGELIGFLLPFGFFYLYIKRQIS
jgi:hypothetical protein